MRAAPVDPAVAARLQALAARDLRGWLSNDPLRYVHRYAELADREVAAVFASSLAFGRVSLFCRVIEAGLALMDGRGGPAAFADQAPLIRTAAERERATAGLEALTYRWNRPPDFALLFSAMRSVRAQHGGIGAAFTGGGAAEALERGFGALRGAIPAEARTPGFLRLLPLPSDRSACKRGCMLLRWMVRRQFPDVGGWDLDPAGLVLPLDVHTGRISRFLGLTARDDGSWRTAEEITAALRRIDPADPVRFDFALAHLGISAGCRGRRDPGVCPGCPLDPVCKAPRA